MSTAALQNKVKSEGLEEAEEILPTCNIHLVLFKPVESFHGSTDFLDYMK